MSKLSFSFLQLDLYLKIGEVRLEVLKALEKLYSNEDYAENLELFTSRFKVSILVFFCFVCLFVEITSCGLSFRSLIIFYLA